MVVRGVHHIPHIVSSPPRSLRNGHMLDLLSKKATDHNRKLAEKLPKDKSKQSFAGTKPPAAIQKKNVLSGTVKKKPLSGAEKALKATPKLSKPTQSPPKVTSPVKGKKLPFPAPAGTKGAAAKKVPGDNLLHQKAKTSSAARGGSARMQPPHPHIKPSQPAGLKKASGTGSQKLKFGKLKEKAVMNSTMPKKPKPVHKSLLNYVKPPSATPR